MQQVETQLKQAEQQKKYAKDDEQHYKDFATKSIIKSIVLEDCQRHSTFCGTCIQRNIVCHENCGLKETTNKEVSIFVNCYCMERKDNVYVCKQCKCGPETHFHARKKLAHKEETIETILNGMKQKHDGAVSQGNAIDHQSRSGAGDLKRIECQVQ